ncbi:hypothetical protein ACE38W_14150 [Chitinophaga sp. Hz27]|uniref:hypothetical protein n=1 Tax=Chitinophaga sp. Hz27 TaxID=3347169 RepID=UPI0035D91346
MNSHYRKRLFLIVAFICTAVSSGFIGYNLHPDNPHGTTHWPAVDSSYSLSVQRAKEYVRNYSKWKDSVTRYPGLLGDISTQGVMVENSRCIWFPAWRMQRLLDLIKADTGTGVRFYFAAYNLTYDRKFTKGQEPAPDTSFWGLNTLLFVPTKDIVSGTDTIHADYYPDPYDSINRHGFIIEASALANSGEMCPPPSNCNAQGATLLENKNNAKGKL